MKTFFKWVAIAIGGGMAAIAVVGGIAIVVAAYRYDTTEDARAEGRFPRRSSTYVRMSDGTRLAVDVVLPTGFAPGNRIPALIKGTPYWRAADYTVLGKAAAELGLVPRDPDVPILNARGYAVVTVDTRGTGASFGYQNVMFSDRELEDFGEIIGWTARQDWSNGRVGAYGFSYRGILAVHMASLHRPELRAIAPSFDFTDMYITAYPGGVFNDRFIEAWGRQNAALNQGKFPCGVVCDLMFAGPRRVRADGDGALLRQAIAEHARNYDIYACARAARNRDDKICDSGKSLGEISQIARKDAIETSVLPMHVVAGWFDANSAAQVLERFATFSNPQSVVVGALSHGGFASTDPFSESAQSDPGYANQISAMADFFDRHLEERGEMPASSVRFQVLNGGGWRTSGTWPPKATGTRFYLAADHALMQNAPAGEGADTYDVDFTASTGPFSRYQSAVDLSRTRYPDRAVQDRKLLTYTSPPLRDDIVMAGNPVVKLVLSTSATDGAVIVYLEHVASDGAVTYVTEGVLRLAHRKRSPDGHPERPGHSLHTYRSADLRPMVPGQAEPVEIELLPIAMVFHKGDRVRVAIAGADAGNLERIPRTGNATLTLWHAGIRQSFLELPVLAMN